MEDEYGTRPCYYVKDRGKRVLIPGCWGAVHSGDMRDCHCDRPSADDRLTKLEKQVAELMKMISPTPPQIVS
jgi:hypothetical protein